MFLVAMMVVVVLASVVMMIMFVVVGIMGEMIVVVVAVNENGCNSDGRNICFTFISVIKKQVIHLYFDTDISKVLLRK
jgi:hypothetical protein